MARYSTDLIEKVRNLRKQGKTYGEIRHILDRRIPKSTISKWCKNTILPSDYSDRIAKLNVDNLNKGRLIALEINKIKRREFFEEIRQKNLPACKAVNHPETAKIALAMLCLGEASKYNPRGCKSFCLGSSDPRIISIFLRLLKRCFNFRLDKVRCTVQCRADQDTKKLEKFWTSVTKIPKRLFYKSRIDPRTVGKPTKKTGYMGVLRIDYLDIKVQLELESLSNLVYNELVKNGPEV